MSWTWTELIYATMSQAQRGTQQAQWDNIDTQGIAEVLMQSVFQQVGEAAAGDERKRSLLKKDVTLTFTNGSATVPDYVLTAYMEDATFTDNSDLTKTYSWVREFSDFINPSLRNAPFSNLGYFNVTNRTTVRQTEPGVAYDPTTGLTGSRHLNIPCVPFRPAAADDVIDVPDEVINDILDVASEALRGQVMKIAAQQT